MMYVMRRRKPEPTLLPTQWIFNLPHHIGMVWEELAFDDAAQLNVIAVTGIRTPVRMVTHPTRSLTNWANSLPTQGRPNFRSDR